MRASETSNGDGEDEVECTENEFRDEDVNGTTDLFRRTVKSEPWDEERRDARRRRSGC
jgi:hypothetical protein